MLVCGVGDHGDFLELCLLHNPCAELAHVGSSFDVSTFPVLYAADAALRFPHDESRAEEDGLREQEPLKSMKPLNVPIEMRSHSMRFHCCGRRGFGIHKVVPRRIGSIRLERQVESEFLHQGLCHEFEGQVCVRRILRLFGDSLVLSL